jgi:hypothetical protein
MERFITREKCAVYLQFLAARLTAPLTITLPTTKIGWNITMVCRPSTKSTGVLRLGMFVVNGN